MSRKLIFHTLGNLLICLAGTMLLPLSIAIYYFFNAGEPKIDLLAFVYATIITLCVGLILRFTIKPAEPELGIREGFAIVTLGWVFVALFGAFPYLFADIFEADGRTPLAEFSFCYFESMSGFSTTGATVLTEIEHLSHAMLFWRSFSHWLGGMGIVVLAVAILPDARCRWNAAVSRRGTRSTNRPTHTTYRTNSQIALGSLYFTLGIRNAAALARGHDPF